MPDLQNFAMIRGSGRSVLLPRYDITFRVTDSNTGAVLHDHTGASGLLFPDLMLTLTEEPAAEPRGTGAGLLAREQR